MNVLGGVDRTNVIGIDFTFEITELYLTSDSISVCDSSFDSLNTQAITREQSQPT